MVCTQSLSQSRCALSHGVISHRVSESVTMCSQSLSHGVQSVTESGSESGTVWSLSLSQLSQSRCAVSHWVNQSRCAVTQSVSYGVQSVTESVTVCSQSLSLSVTVWSASFVFKRLPNKMYVYVCVCVWRRSVSSLFLRLCYSLFYVVLSPHSNGWLA